MSNSPCPASSFTLRQLPVPAKLVLTVFLMSVGLGYSSAMIQLHMQHSDRDGSLPPLPTAENVVAIFAGKKWYKPGEAAEKTACKLECIISGSPKGELTAKNMAPAFFAQDGADFEKKAKENPAQLSDLEARREGERKAVIAWINTAEQARRTAYETDKFTLPKDLFKQPLSEDFKTNPRADPESVMIQSLLKARCHRCHQPGGEKSDVPLRTYPELEKFLPKTPIVPEGGGWIDSGRQMSLEKLTQSTHAHLLSFSVLFALTGLVFAFTSYPSCVRCIIAPLVLVAQVADVSCWWLARESTFGPYFAMCIIGTGGVVGLGLMTQILFSLWNMYGPKGKTVLLLLFLLAGGAGAVAFLKVVGPFLDNEKQEKAAHEAANGNGKQAQPNDVAKGGPAAPAKAEPNMEASLTGAYPGVKWGKGKGGMVLAFFDKDNDFKKADADDKKKLTPEREGERLALLAWIKAAPEVRKAAYEADKFEARELAGKALTDDYKAGDGIVKIKSILSDRCARCHTAGGAKEEMLMDTYEQIQKYIRPAKGTGN